MNVIGSRSVIELQIPKNMHVSIRRNPFGGRRARSSRVVPVTRSCEIEPVLHDPKGRMRVTSGGPASSRAHETSSRGDFAMTHETLTADAAPRSFKASYEVFSFFLLVANLRPALTSVGPLLEAIRSSLGLSGAAVGLLSALPLLIFASFSPFARLGNVVGIERTLAGCLALIIAGSALRSQGSIVALFAGTVIFATGIGVANVLVPSVIKRDFPHQVESMTTAYVMVMALTGAVATGLAVPLSAHLPGGWRSSLAIWAIFAALSLLCWLPSVRKPNIPSTTQQPDHDRAAVGPIWRSSVAWHVTLFMGLQFLIYYVVIGWMPLFLIAYGVSETEAGWLLTLYQVVSFGVGLAAPMLMRRGRDQRALAVIASSVTALCILALLVVPSLAGLWLIACGASFGITFILAFALIAMRTRDHRSAASLSTMSQATAYLIAATGPVAFGWLHDLTTGWTVPMVSLLAVALIQAIVGLGAGRRRYI
jgi:MFS transporter, CP family, cyanate transporter